MRAHLAQMRGAEETYPFGEDVLVVKVAGKMFALLPHDPVPPRVNLKCEPDFAIELRSRFDAIGPGYHMNKKHWNTVLLDGTVPDALLLELVQHSWDLVVRSLPRSKRALLGGE